MAREYRKEMALRELHADEQNELIPHYLSLPHFPMPSPLSPSLSAQKEQARECLNTNRVEDALALYAQILATHPEDMDALLALGDCYLAAEQIPAALKLYRRAAGIDPKHPELQRRLLLVQLEPEDRLHGAVNGNLIGQEAVVRLAVLLGGGNALVVTKEGGGKKTGFDNHPTDAQALEAEMAGERKLQARTTEVNEAMLARAEGMLREVFNSSSPGKVVSERLDEIDALLPALLALNVREAQERVHPGLVQSLEGVMGRVDLMGNGADGRANGHATNGKRAPARVAFVHPAGGEISARHTLAAEGLAARGCEITRTEGLLDAALDEFDVIIAHRPHTDPDLMRALAQRVAAQVPVAVDVEMDFEQLPGNHAGEVGLETPEQARLYMAALLMAQTVVVSGEELGALLQHRGHPVRVIPDGWSRENRLWEKPATRRHTINIGVVAGQVEDVMLARRMILRILREFPQTQLVVVGNPLVYQLFDGLPEARRLFLPPANEADFPYLLSQVDILLAPMRQTPFNLTCSDRVLMEAGVRGIPWVASAIPAFTAWAEGGVIAHAQEDWYALLHGLITDSTLRRDLGQAGQKQAASREMGVLGEAWWELVESIREIV